MLLVQRVEAVVYGGVVSAGRREPFSYEDPIGNGEMRLGILNKRRAAGFLSPNEIRERRRSP
jgi:hypothetical protein